ncbi:outer membrane beta-barrel family protein [Jiulongibacter sediminis]|uniref:outer membrane beta-barrel family protein n=1 Tax=Jiulongibacter sediminis TaxID=1605367 RepID=UPI0006DD334C|nr:outer membrane beta-barrel family protein [Jiulongibacter sediminis]
MKNYLRMTLVLLALTFSQSVLAQQGRRGPGAAVIANASISGTVIDSTSSQGVEFAAVALWDATKAIDGTLTDIKGSFKFEGVKAGTYKLLISYIGYSPQSVENIVVPNNDAKVDLGNVFILSDNIQLNEVTVTGQAALVEDKIDRLVYNADKDITNRGGTAEEVLRKVPMLSVDLDGEVELRGSSNVRVLIDNKPSTIFASSVGEALKQIPSDQIKSVEVITSPSAKYDGEGTAGIININLKKNTLAGVTGMISTGVGVQGSNLNGSLNLKDKKWGIAINGGGRMSYNFRTEGLNTRESVINGEATYLTQEDNNRGQWGGGRYRGTFTYDFDKKTNFSISYSGRARINGSEGDQLTRLVDGNNALIFENTRFIDQSNISNSADLDFTFNKRYANPIQELSILAQFSKSNRNEDFTALQNGLPADSSDNVGIDQELNFSLDYVQPLGEKIKWEMGGKGVFRGATSDGNFYSYSLENAAYALNSLRSNFLDYDQNVAAGYSSFTLELPNKWGVQAGVRYERTMITAQFKERADVEIPDYDNWLPSINLSKRFEKGGSVRASYTQRIQRPSIRFLNPYVDYSNQNSISFGQPTLAPELVDMLELSTSTYFGRNSINFSIYSRIEDNSITSVSEVVREDGIDITQTTFANIGVNKRFGADLSFNVNPNKDWRIGGGVSPNYTYMDNRTISNQGWNVGLNLNSQYSLPKGFAVAVFGFYRSPRVQLQGTRNGFYFHGLTFKKDINDKRGSFGLGLENPFVRSIDFKSTLENVTDANNYFISANTRSMFRRSIRVDFQYRFGKMENDGRGLFNRRRGGNNDSDAMDDDGGNGQEMMR